MKANGHRNSAVVRSPAFSRCRRHDALHFCRQCGVHDPYRETVCLPRPHCRTASHNNLSCLVRRLDAFKSNGSSSKQ